MNTPHLEKERDIRIRGLERPRQRDPGREGGGEQNCDSVEEHLPSMCKALGEIPTLKRTSSSY